MVSFYVLCVVMLNLLIAIISDKFDNVYEQAQSSDCQEKCQLIIEFEEFKLLFIKPLKRLCSYSKEDGKKFLHLLRYEQESQEEDDNQDQWEGKIRAMKNKINKLDNTVTSSTKTIKDTIQDSEYRTLREMEQIKENTERIKKDTEEMGRRIIDKLMSEIKQIKNN